MRRTTRETIDDGCLDLSAELAYYFFLSLFPALLFLLGLASFFRLTNLSDDVVRVLGPLVSPEIVELIQAELRRLAEAHHGGIATIGLLGAFWSSSSAIVAIVTSVNRAYDLPESRSWWRVRLLSIWLTVILAVATLLAVALLMSGPGLAAFLRVAGDSVLWSWSWNLVRWPGAFVLVAGAIGVIYHYAPDAEQDWAWVTPGAVLATALWGCSSFAFKYYAAHFGNYQATYGALGGVVVLMLWFYLTGLGILVGAELNSEIEHAAPHAERPVVSPETGRRVIGSRALRLSSAR